MLDALILLMVSGLALGFCGRWSEPLDMLSHFRAHLAAALLAVSVLALLLGHSTSGAVGGLVAVLSLVSVAPFALPMRKRPVAERESYTLLQMNLLWNTGDYAAAVRRIAEIQPDIVTLQELTPEWLEALRPIEAFYPFRVIAPDADGFRGDSAILSRLPFAPGSIPVCESDISLAAARIDFGGVAATIASHHQLWPRPRGQWRRLDAAREKLAALPAPLLLAGDFNAVGWSAFLAAYAKVTRTRVVRGVGPTWMLDRLPPESARFVGVGIDNFLASPAIAIQAIERPAATGSDHLPILVRFKVRPAA